MNADSEGQGYWAPLADLMTGLMMLFMLIAVSYMCMVEEKAISNAKNNSSGSAIQTDIQNDLHLEFNHKLKNWNAKFVEGTGIQFLNADALFDTGRANIKPKFRAILNEFIPKYIKILSQPKYRKYIKEIRIEGHTSPGWDNVSLDQAYYNNMRLSQERTASTLYYLLNHRSVDREADWLRTVLTANGLSSSNPIYLKGTKIIDSLASQRVEFKIITISNASKEISNAVRKDGK